METITLRPARVAFVTPTAVQITAAEKLVKAQLVAVNVAVDPVKYVNDPVLVKAFPGQFSLSPPRSIRTVVWSGRAP